MTSSTRLSFSIRALLLATVTSVVNVGGLTLLGGWAMPASAAPDAPGSATPVCAPVTSAQHQILEAAANGVDALREHLWVRRGIRDYDLVATVQWIDDYRIRSAGCDAATAQVALVAPGKPASGSIPVDAER